MRGERKKTADPQNRISRPKQRCLPGKEGRAGWLQGLKDARVSLRTLTFHCHPTVRGASARRHGSPDTGFYEKLTFGLGTVIVARLLG